MYIFHFVPLFAAVINLILGIVVFLISPKKRLNQVFALLALALFDWNICTYILAHTHDKQNAFFWARISAIGLLAIAPLLYHLANETLAPGCRRRSILFAYTLTAVSQLLIPSKFFFESIRPFGHIFRPTAGPALWVSYGVLFTVCAAAICILVRSRTSAPALMQRRIDFSIAAVSILTIGLFHDSLFIFILGLNQYPHTQISIKPLGTLCASIYGLLSGYSLLSDQFFDLRVSIGRGAATWLRVFFLVGICYLLLLGVAGIFPGLYTSAGVLVSLTALFIGILITTRFFPKILGELPTRFDRALVGDRFEYLDKIRAYLGPQQSPQDFAEFLNSAARLVYDQIKLNAIGITIYGGDKDARQQVVLGCSKSYNWGDILGEESPLRTYFKSASQPYIDIREGSRFGPEEQAARTLMSTHSLVLAFPIGAEEKKNAGLLVVGPRKDGRPLNQLDAEVLASLCRHIATRIERIALERNEELQKSNEAKDLFLASVNHEIRNPLNGITGVVQMLQDHCTDPRAKFLLGTLQTCTDQLRTTMDDVLDFNQMGPEVPSNHPSRVALVDLVRSITKSYDFAGDQLLFGGVTGDLKSIQSPEPELLIWCDSGKLSHILTNYLINSLKYGVPPGACVQLHAEAKGDAAVRVKLTVTSTGPTLSPDEVLSLFTPLTRGRRAQETKANGLGLGLALSKKLAEAMGGNVGVESAHGKTTFWFVAEFPLVNPDDPQASRPVLDVAGRFALAIEDEPYNRLVLGYHLNRFGISPIWATDGASALGAAQNRSFDLIILDWRLPDMEGEELLSKLRANSPKPLPPVVVVSAYSSANKRAASFAVGAAAFVNKPIDESKLAAALGTCRLGPPVTIFDAGDSPTELLDISALKAASSDPAVIESFLREIEQSCTKLLASWKLDARAAASLAHRLKGQMLLVRAKESAGLLEVMERALNEGAASADIERLAEAIQREFATVIRSIRALTDSAPGTASA